MESAAGLCGEVAGLCGEVAGDALAYGLPTGAEDDAPCSAIPPFRRAGQQREQATGRRLPVIALTARAMRSDRERCLQAGMDDFVAKPIAAAELFRVMDRVLAGRPAAEPAPPARGCPESLIDAATLLAACDDDPALLRELIQVFRADNPGVLARVRIAVNQQDALQLREAAHELRGLLSTFSAMAAAEAARLETTGAGGQLDDAASTLDGLIEMVGRLDRHLEELSIEQLRHQAAGGGGGPV
jgi:two-component system sensor histidine kinase/response regulator